MKQWNVAFEELDISTRYGTTHIITAGNHENPPLVLFHGVGDDSALMWIYNIEALASGLRVYAVDTIGGPGKSEMGKAYGRSFDDVLWIDDILDQLGIDKTNIAGVSHGGYLSQLYTLKRPGRVNRTLCISSAVPDGVKGSPMNAMLKVFMPEALFPTKKNTEKLLRKLSGNNVEAFIGNADILCHYRALLKGFNNMAMGYHKVTGFSPDEIAQIREKTLYLAGEEDPFQKLGGKEALLRNNMHAIWYPNAGHGLNHELAEQVNQKMLEYFLSVSHIYSSRCLNSLLHSCAADQILFS